MCTAQSFILGCESFATNFASVKPAVCVGSYRTNHQISSLNILGTKCTLNIAAHVCKVTFKHLSQPISNHTKSLTPLRIATTLARLQSSARTLLGPNSQPVCFKTCASACNTWWCHWSPSSHELSIDIEADYVRERFRWLFCNRYIHSYIQNATL